MNRSSQSRVVAVGLMLSRIKRPANTTAMVRLVPVRLLYLIIGPGSNNGLGLHCEARLALLGMLRRSGQPLGHRFGDRTNVRRVSKTRRFNHILVHRSLTQRNAANVNRTSRRVRLAPSVG